MLWHFNYYFEHCLNINTTFIQRLNFGGNVKVRKTENCRIYCEVYANNGDFLCDKQQQQQFEFGCGRKYPGTYTDDDNGAEGDFKSTINNKHTAK